MKGYFKIMFLGLLVLFSASVGVVAAPVLDTSPTDNVDFSPHFIDGNVLSVNLMDVQETAIDYSSQNEMEYSKETNICSDLLICLFIDKPVDPGLCGGFEV